MFTTEIRVEGDGLVVEIPAELLAEIHVEPPATVIVSRTADGALRVDPHDPDFAEKLDHGRGALRDFRSSIRSLATAS